MISDEYLQQADSGTFFIKGQTWGQISALKSLIVFLTQRLWTRAEETIRNS